MRKDFETVAKQVSIESVAKYLGLQKDGKLYKYPDERTGSIKLYPESNSFFDFGRSIGGDSVKLWSHVRGCDSWTALKEMPDRAGKPLHAQITNHILIHIFVKLLEKSPLSKLQSWIVSA